MLDRWRKTGAKPSQNQVLIEALQVLIEALQEYLKNSGVNISQIEEDVGEWKPKEERTSKIAKFPKRRRGN